MRLNDLLFILGNARKEIILPVTVIDVTAPVLIATEISLLMILDDVTKGQGRRTCAQ